MKPNNTIKYVHRKSNHSTFSIKNIPASINKRLFNISSSEKIFNRAKTLFQQALKDSGYEYDLKYQSTQICSKRTRKRDIIWYNPPYTKSVATNIEKKFLTIVRKEYGIKHTLSKILNKNTLKLS